jgi:tetratricopeptide (TPR) repeat protein
LGWVVLYTGENYRIAGDLSAACTCYERTRALVDTADDAPLRAAAAHYFGIALHGAGEFRQSIQLFREVDDDPRAFEGARRLASASPERARIANISWLVRSLAVMGEFDEAIIRGREALAGAEEVGNPYSVVLAALALGEIHRERGNKPLRCSSMPGDWTVQRGHDFLEEIERRIGEQLASVTVFTHLEPIEDPS